MQLSDWAHLYLAKICIHGVLNESRQHNDDSGRYHLCLDREKPHQEPVKLRSGQPLAYRMRPKTLNDVIGQEKLISFLKKLIESDNLLSMVFYGQPGIGKTTGSLMFDKKDEPPSFEDTAAAGFAIGA